MKKAWTAIPFLLAASHPVLAKTDWAKAGLDPAMAYVLVQVEPLHFRFMGNNDIATNIILHAYDDEKSNLRFLESKDKSKPDHRVLLDKVDIAKAGKRRQYFTAIMPGTWVIEGAGGNGGTLGAPITSFALGSHRFEAHAGEVIDLGVLAPSSEESDNPDTKMSTGKLAGMIFAGPFGGGRVESLPLKIAVRPRADGDFPVPAWLSKANIVQPGFTYGATFSNLMGGLVNRVDGKAGRSRTVGEVVYLSRPGQPKVEAAVLLPVESAKPVE
jgi:hypothetical protein